MVINFGRSLISRSHLDQFFASQWYKVRKFVWLKSTCYNQLNLYGLKLVNNLNLQNPKKRNFKSPSKRSPLRGFAPKGVLKGFKGVATNFFLSEARGAKYINNREAKTRFAGDIPPSGTIILFFGAPPILREGWMWQQIYIYIFKMFREASKPKKTFFAWRQRNKVRSTFLCAVQRLV